MRKRKDMTASDRLESPVAQSIKELADLRQRTRLHFKQSKMTDEKIRNLAEQYKNGDGITIAVLEKFKKV
jgi:hypothetical protein